MDKSWMKIKNYLDPIYLNRVEEFIKFADLGKDSNSNLPCPCTLCNTFEDQTIEVMDNHLSCKGIDENYTRWIHHGESFEESDEENNGVDMIKEDSDSDGVQEMLNAIGVANFSENWRNLEDPTSDVSYEQEEAKLIELWVTSIQTCDASIGEKFILCAALL
ncbi:hypothetical protein ACH5RR_030028 [Cinchona calisaya]|uniref:Transposase-associated domain-containing protein n=1 Tax=Cinchona calisaya TaxID=153742 RepID=A0ABD2YTG6_9GENT